MYVCMHIDATSHPLSLSLSLSRSLSLSDQLRPSLTHTHRSHTWYTRAQSLCTTHQGRHSTDVSQINHINPDQQMCRSSRQNKRLAVFSPQSRAAMLEVWKLASTGG